MTDALSGWQARFRPSSTARSDLFTLDETRLVSFKLVVEVAASLREGLSNHWDPLIIIAWQIGGEMQRDRERESQEFKSGGSTGCCGAPEPRLTDRRRATLLVWDPCTRPAPLTLWLLA